jgi:hypothetical protein
MSSSHYRAPRNDPIVPQSDPEESRSRALAAIEPPATRELLDENATSLDDILDYHALLFNIHRARDNDVHASNDTVKLASLVLRINPLPYTVIHNDCIQNSIINAYLRAEQNTVSPRASDPILRLGLKPRPPKRYSGKDRSIACLEAFVYGVFRWFKARAMLRLDMDRATVNQLESFLTGDASRWFERHVAGRRSEWTMFQVLEGLRRRFIRDVNYHLAALEFDDVRQEEDQSVQDYTNEFNARLRRVLVTPDRYDFRRLWLYGLNWEIAERLVLWGFTAERHTLQQLQDKALAAEDSLSY